MLSTRARKRLIGAGALVGAAVLAAVTAAVPASAEAGPTTTVWAGKSYDRTEQPDPGSGDFGDGIIRFNNPEDAPVVPGATVDLAFVASCMDPFVDGGQPEIKFYLDTNEEQALLPAGEWDTQDPGMNYFYGHLSFTMPAEDVNLKVVAKGTRCFKWIEAAPVDEHLYKYRAAAVQGVGGDAGQNGAAPALALSLGFEAGASITKAGVVATATGLKPGSDWMLQMFSDPRTLATGVAGADGRITQAVSLPADTPAGAHRLLLTGVAADGSALTSEAWFAVDANGTITAVSMTGPVAAPAAQLASTGFDGTAGFVALFGVLAGSVLLLVRRRTAQ